MIQEETNNATGSSFVKKRHRINHEKPAHFKLRNTLNIIFIAMAVMGIIVYFVAGQFPGYIIMGVAMIFKFVECIFRFLH